MAITVTDFRAFFPEFIDAEDALIELHLVDARDITPLSVFGSQQYVDKVVKYRAADSLACSPWGRHARLVSDGTTDSTSVYGKKLKELLDGAPAGGPWVPGVCY